MKIEKDFLPSLTGALLIAHPGLLDPGFAKSVVLLSVHSEKGSVGVVLNRSMGLSISEYDPAFVDSPLAGVPLFLGGPVADDKIIITAWEWLECGSVFKLYFGITEEKTDQLSHSKHRVDIRAFKGYSVWTEGQLEQEIEDNAWIVSSVKNLAQPAESYNIWKSLLAITRPGLLFLADSPDDPAVN